MVNDIERQKSIDSIRKQFAKCAATPPREDPFSRKGSQAWQDWSELCRGYESELRGAGVSL